jgi:hypothetical protein
MRKREIQVRVVGGLGNQLFVYFAGLYLSQVSGRILVLDLRDASRVHSSFDLRSFKEIVKVKSKTKLRNQILIRIIASYRFRFPGIARLTDNIAGIFFDEGFHANVARARTRRKKIKLSGYFQDFQYMENLGNFKLTLDSSMLGHPTLEGKCVLAIHIRRGDFVNEKETHGCLDVSWYRKAIALQLQSAPEVRLIKIFSNDTEWVRLNLSLICPETNIEVEVIKFEAQQDPAINLLEFAACEYRVCSNSTYSLLASFLFPGKTVVPFPYNRSGNFKALEDSSPTEWLRIPSIWEG